METFCNRHWESLHEIVDPRCMLHEAACGGAKEGCIAVGGVEVFCLCEWALVNTCLDSRLAVLLYLPSRLSHLPKQ